MKIHQLRSAWSKNPPTAVWRHSSWWIFRKGTLQFVDFSGKHFAAGGFLLGGIENFPQSWGKYRNGNTHTHKKNGPFSYRRYLMWPPSASKPIATLIVMKDLSAAANIAGALSILFPQLLQKILCFNNISKVSNEKFYLGDQRVIYAR